jgi:UDP-N-acetylmuramoylalanine--D-glutamate ligase
MKRVVIIGGGESGVGAALLAQKKGYDVFLSDSGKLSEGHRKELKDKSIPFEEGGHSFERLLRANLVIKSPGVPDDAEPCRLLNKQGCDIISEIEFGSYFYSGKIIAVTGSNGKTTTSGLIHHLLLTGGKDVAIGGNYGTSFCRLLTADSHPEYMVLELSSFQLDGIRKFRPDVALLLNITPDHLDRYDYDVRKYGRAKLKICQNQKKGDVFIYNGDDALTQELLPKGMLMTTIVVNEKDYIDGIYSKELDSYFEINLIGKHNLFNACCAIMASRSVGLDEESLHLGLKTFRNVPHRMETIAEIDGVTYINDSKATNVDAVFYALDGLNRKIVWIAGGTDKGNDYTPLIPLVSAKVKALICLGLDNEKLKSAFQSVVPHIEEVTDVVSAIERASAYAGRGEVVLLSPACASFDLFKNYMDRGDQFRDAVWHLCE